MFGIIVGGVDFTMLLSDWFLERQEKRIQAARKEGYAEAKAENGKAVEESPDSASKSSDSPPKPFKKS